MIKFPAFPRVEEKAMFFVSFTSKLTVDICPSLVGPSSRHRFRNKDTDGHWVNYKDYREIYPKWSIMPSANPVSAKYWKSVFARYQKEFASHYTARRGDIPKEWRKYTRKEVSDDMEELYHTKIRN